MAFRIGQKVVCVDAKGSDGIWYPGEEIEEGKVYTIHSVLTHPTKGNPLVRLQELKRVPECMEVWGHDGYGAYRFRPAVERKTDISFAHEILRKASKPAKLPVVTSAQHRQQGE